MSALTSTRSSDARLELAWRLLDEVDSLSLGAFQAGGHRVRRKADGSPVTDVDVAIQELMSDRIRRVFPDDVVLGEENSSRPRGDDLWIIDPLDGTSHFIEGIPIYAHLLVRLRLGSPVFAIVSAPALGKRWWAYRGVGAFRWDERIRVSDTREVASALITYGGLVDYGNYGDAFTALVRSCARSRGFGNFFPHMLVAEGTYDLASSGGGGGVWDVAPLALVVTEAGGSITAFDGGAWDARRPVLTSNSALHDHALAILATARPRMKG
ncbi:MAG TPA: inositol monophosphatase [Umezawaea sp.]|nr:inositol monophosphatase [Umezawaea sp.]